jgi:hypothetical protein
MLHIFYITFITPDTVQSVLTHENSFCTDNSKKLCCHCPILPFIITRGENRQGKITCQKSTKIEENRAWTWTLGSLVPMLSFKPLTQGVRQGVGETWWLITIAWMTEKENTTSWPVFTINGTTCDIQLSIIRPTAHRMLKVFVGVLRAS